jgi:hypothetical protein
MDNSNNKIDVRNEKGITITFWIKFYGTVEGITTACPTIVRFSRIMDSFLCIDAKTQQLKFFYQTVNLVFSESIFIKDLGQWSFISVSNYYAPNDLHKTFPNMMNLWIKTDDLPRQGGFFIPGPGLQIDYLDLGYEIIALFADLKFYKNYIIEPYARVMHKSPDIDLYLKRSLTGTSATNCLTVDDVDGGNLGIYGHSCSADYNPYLDSKNRCTDSDTKYFNYTESPDFCKNSCDSKCTSNTQNCAKSTKLGCSCNINDNSWLRKDNITNNIFCDQAPYYDFAQANSTTITGIETSSTDEYSIEFYYYVYSYNEKTIGYTSFEIIWNNHLKAIIYNESNQLKLKCHPVYRQGNTISSQNIIDPDTAKYYRWNYGQCSTSLNDMKYYVNEIPEQTIVGSISKLGNVTSSDMIMQHSPGSATNYGFLFIREIKLWATYNLR